MPTSDELYNRALNLSYFFLKFRPRTEKEVVKYLERKSKKYNLSQNLINQLIEHLTELNLINDRDFISWFVDQRNSSKPKSRFALSQELIRFGITKELIEEYFDKNELDELELAKTALQKKSHFLKNLHDQKNYQRAFNFLLRRGFSYEVCRKVLQILKNGVK